MEEMTIQQLTEYLKRVSELEMLVYKQEQIRDEAERGIPSTEVYRRKPRMPEDNRWRINKVKRREKNTISDFIFPVLGLIFGLSLYVFLFWMHDAFDAPWDFWNVLLAFVGGFFLVASICGLSGLIKDNMTIESDYQAALNQYERQRRKAEQEYDVQYQRYLEEKRQADKEYCAEVEIARKSCAKAKAQVRRLDGPLEETKRLLNRLYSFDIIFSKYRNLIAMCTMYEYFASGRCTELVGPNGAYNLYEAELRQNLIINHLETVNNNLEQIKDNQYTLYHGIQDVNESLKGVRSDIQRVATATESIVESSKITAVCTEVAAKNIETLKYISMVK